MSTAVTILMLLAIMSFQLCRAPLDVPATFVFSGLAAFALIGLTRIALQRWRPVSIGRTWILLARFVPILAAVMLIGLGAYAAEEAVLLLLLAVAVAVWMDGTTPQAMRQVAVLAIVVVLFSLPSLHERYHLAIICGTALAGGLFLMASHVDAKSRLTWVYGAAISAIIAIACVLAHPHFKPVNQNPWFAAWSPSSGGPGEGSDRARRGVGDGPDEISSASADSIGFDHGETFSESGRDGLYDLWVESYGEPTPPGEQQKMIGLKPKDVTVVQAADRENLRVGRSFEMQRRREAGPTPRADVKASALLWIKGPLPAYVPLAAFETYNPIVRAWDEVAPGKSASPVKKAIDSDWMEILHRPISPAFGDKLAYQLRIGELGGEILPLLPSTEQFRMGRVNRADFFASTQSGLVRLARRTLPPGAMLDVICNEVAPARLVAVEPALPKHVRPVLLETPADDPRIIPLATEFGAGHERGWKQIEQVVRNVRQIVTHDRDRTQPASDLIGHVLVQRHASTDYEIATATAMLLRALGYPTRLASGFFADESMLDASSGQVPLGADQVHFWIEVRLADGTWVTVDPTPGYPLLNLPRSAGEWFAGVWTDLQWFAGRYAGLIAACVGACVCIWWLRKQCVDVVVTAWCWLQGHRPERVLRLIELRARMASLPRAAAQPVGTWLLSLDAGDDMRSFVSAINRRLYQPSADTYRVSITDHDASRHVASTMTRRRIKALARGINQ